MATSTGAGERGRRGVEVVLFHSVLGLRPGVLQWAERLREAGHTVHTPDLHGGAVCDDYDAGLRHMEALGGIGALIERTHAAVADLPGDVVYAGFSNGGGSAELLALTRPGARGAILMHAALPVEAFGASAWPAGLPVQIHYSQGDPFREPGSVEALAAAVERAGGRCERHEYAGAGHLFADPEHPDFDAEAAELMFQRVTQFLSTLEPAGVEQGVRPGTQV
jgi:dienelactone hydrolase